ncbi:hypothetical protein GCM10025734_05980 [Kitasatospora paranensis]
MADGLSGGASPVRVQLASSDGSTAPFTAGPPFGTVMAEPCVYRTFGPGLCGVSVAGSPEMRDEMTVAQMTM